MNDESRIDRIADLAGIQSSYRDMSDREVPTSPEARRAVLAALGLAVDSSAAIAASLGQLEERANAVVPRLILAEADRPVVLTLNGTDAPTIHWRITNEAGAATEGRAEVSQSASGPQLKLAPLAAGYFKLSVRAGHRSAETLIISAPTKCWRPGGGRRWGIASQVYALTSATNLGIGDLTDIGALAEAAGRLGGDFIGLSPLHALFPAERGHISPYSPSSRLFRDAIYIDPKTAPAFDSGAKALLDAAEADGSLASARSGDLVDYRAVWSIKRPILGAQWQAFKERGGDTAFDEFRARAGVALEQHATFDALQEVFAARGIHPHQWPAAYRDSGSPEVQGFRGIESDLIAFHAWLQWVADTQVGAAAARARSAGMEVGLYADLAVGADRSGSEVWANPGYFGLGLSIGAPPDALAPHGQDWGLPPLHPLALLDNGLAPFRAAIAAAMRHAGAIRIDHAFQLRRLFLMPSGQPASLGAYVSYPSDALLAVLRIESHRAHCLVIGEDLGTTPPGFAETLADSDILSYRVLYFERRGQDFIPPEDYPTLALAVINTHDLATFAGWWHGQDIMDRASHGVSNLEQTADGEAQRETEREALTALLFRHGLVTTPTVPTEPPFDPVVHLVARCRSELVSVQIDDLAGATQAQNIPGIVDGAPNWRRRTPMAIEAFGAADGPLDRLARTMAAEGRGKSRKAKETPTSMKPAVTKKPPPRRSASATAPTTNAPTGDGRVVIEAVSPEIDGGLTPAKRIVGDLVEVSADIFTDGHDKIAAEILYRRRDESEWRRAPMQHLENDRWFGAFPVEENARHVFTIEAWRDPYASWRSDVEKKRAAGQVVDLEMVEGRHIVEHAVPVTADETKALAALRSSLNADKDDTEKTWALLTSTPTAGLLGQRAERVNLSRHARELDLIVDRKTAQFSAWYELFPRSAAQDTSRHGNFDDVVRLLSYVRDLGFDVLYFPPIHPIGVTNRKGKNNSLRAGPGDPGSVYAIGGSDGGHDALHPELGTIEDFRRLVAAAKDHGLEIALDFAIQCSPDHPWIKEHPEWFEWRPDGTLKFAENPPKKYEDIVNVHFYGESLPSLWYALRDVVLFWASEGVRIFRVDNPHTKPLPFWQWMIGEVNDQFPDVLFLAEAFTRPKMMNKLAKVGFQQSYTYFTWRDTKAELIEYVTELGGEMSEFYRPNFFANTPDINPVYLQNSGRAGFLVRSTLAATLSSNWGIYSGFELCEATPLPGKEEYLDSEKYEFRAWDLERPGNIRQHITALNRIRRENPALHDFRGTQFVNAWNDNVIAYFKRVPGDPSGILVLVNLDPHHVQNCWYEVPMWEFGLPDDAVLVAEDLLLGISFELHGKNHQIALDPSDRPVMIWRLAPKV